MPTGFILGPANGQILDLTRKPRFLRVCYERLNKKFRALCKIGDRPNSREMVYVYCLNDNGEYRYYKNNATASELISNVKWQCWCRKELRYGDDVLAGNQGLGTAAEENPGG